jgi:hypothetical protein
MGKLVKMGGRMSDQYMGVWIPICGCLDSYMGVWIPLDSMGVWIPRLDSTRRPIARLARHIPLRTPPRVDNWNPLEPSECGRSVGVWNPQGVAA